MIIKSPTDYSRKHNASINNAIEFVNETYYLNDGIYSGTVIESKIVLTKDKRRWILKIKLGDNNIYISVNSYPISINTTFGNTIQNCIKKFGLQSPEHLLGADIEFEIKNREWQDKNYSNITNININ